MGADHARRRSCLPKASGRYPGYAVTELDVRVRRVHERRCHPETLSVIVAWLPLSVRSREPEPLDWLSTFSDAW